MRPKTRSEQGRGLFYTRDSGGKHETTPGEYVEWARREAAKLGVSFQGTAEAIETMIRTSQAISGDLFLDFGVPGNVMVRAGLNSLIETARKDLSVSHVFIPRRNRLARPDSAIDGITLELAVRSEGITLVFMDYVLLPLPKGKRQGIAELLGGIIDYDRSAEDRRELAQKVLFAQLGLAKSGFSTGGRPPYGFRRWFAKEDGTPVRELNKGECVKMQGHHVVWLPGPEEEWVIIRRILKMLETMPASKVAKTLTKEGVPTPDFGRQRTDNGVRHQTSGVWHQPTITNIARNPLLLAMMEYGRRSMGDQLRFTAEGPRELGESDFIAENGKPKVIRNSEPLTARGHFEPQVDPVRHQKLLAKLDAAGETQRGKPRSQDPDNNPLGCRVVDMACGWPMYRTPYGQTFRYKCGFYQQSHGAECSHNHVEGVAATKFVLSCLRQRALTPERIEKLERRIRELAASDQGSRRAESQMADLRAKLQQLERERNLVSTNMARAKSDDQFAAISDDFNQLGTQIKAVQKELSAAESDVHTNDIDTAVEQAVQVLHQLTDLASACDNLGAAGRLFELVNARLYLQYQPTKVKKRILNKITHGVVTFGDALPPVEIYRGPTSRKAIAGQAASAATRPGQNNLPPDGSVSSGEEDKSLGNVSRGEWIRTTNLRLRSIGIELSATTTA